MTQKSKKFTLDLADFWSVAKTALLVGGAAALTYVAQNLGHLDLGSFGPLVVPIIAVALDAVIKWMKDNTKTKD